MRLDIGWYDQGSLFFVDITLVAQPFYLFSTPIMTLSNHFMNVLLSLSIVSVWLLPRFGTEAVSHVVLEDYYIALFSLTSQGPPSDTYIKCLEEVQTISCATLFAPVTRQEAVQAMSKSWTVCHLSRLTLSVQFWSLDGRTMAG